MKHTVQIHRPTNRQRDKQTERQRDRQTDRHTDGEIDIQTDRRRDRQTESTVLYFTDVLSLKPFFAKDDILKCNFKQVSRF